MRNDRQYECRKNSYYNFIADSINIEKSQTIILCLGQNSEINFVIDNIFLFSTVYQFNKSKYQNIFLLVVYLSVVIEQSDFVYIYTLKKIVFYF